MAVSAYACPGLASGAAAMTMPAAASMAADAAKAPEAAALPQGADCEDMMGAKGPSFSNLCAAHCQQGQQSDHAPTVTVPALLLNALYMTPVAAEAAIAPRPAADAASARAAAFPPHAILHCCFRI